MLPDDMPLDECPIYIHAWTRLRNFGLQTVGDFRKLTDEELWAVPGIGRLRFAHLREALGPHGARH